VRIEEASIFGRGKKEAFQGTMKRREQ